jgi:hypothetical protein
MQFGGEVTHFKQRVDLHRAPLAALVSGHVHQEKMVVKIRRGVSCLPVRPGAVMLKQSANHLACVVSVPAVLRSDISFHLR